MNQTNIVIARHTPEKQARAKAFRQTMTPVEAALWQAMRGNRLHGLHFRRQQVIDGFIADFYCHVAGLVLELDGGVHQQQADYDALRDQIIAARGLRVLRFANERITHDLPAVLDEIHAAAQERLSSSLERNQA